MVPEPEDTALMLRYADGDAAAFEILYRRHNDALYRYFLRLCRQRATAEDLYQETWSRVIRARQRYRPTAKFTTWLYRVAHNCFVDHYRRNRRHAMRDRAEPDQQRSDAPAPDELAERALARRRLERALDALPYEQRDTFLLREEAHLGLEQIAEITGVSRETAKSRLRYAVKKLRAAIDEPHAELSEAT